MNFEDLQEIVDKNMLLADRDVVKMLASFVVCARMPMNPPWIFLVGPSSGGKSMLLSALEACNGFIPLDDLSPNTFASGMVTVKGSTSLLDQMLPNSVIVFKDFTTIISKDKENRAVVVAQLRKIYDGDFSKRWGNGQEIKWKGKLSVLAGVTSKVYSAMYAFADMGERFLMYTMKQPDRIEVGMLATENLNDKKSNEAISKAFVEYLDSLPIPSEPVQIDRDTRLSIVHLAELTTRARSSVERDMYSREKEIRQVHFVEMTPRFAKQLTALATGFTVINNSPQLTEQDHQIIYRIALDSIPVMRRICLKALTKYKQVETAGLSVSLKLPSSTVRVHLQDLAALEVVNFSKKSNNRDTWELKENYRKILSRYEGIALTDETLTEENSATAEVALPLMDEDEQKSLQSIADMFGGEIVSEPSFGGNFAEPVPDDAQH